MRILAVGPHPDDIEAGCLGTLLKFKNDGHDVHVIVTVKPSAEINKNRNEEIVWQELRCSMNLADIDCQVLDTNLSNTGRPRLEWNNDTITEFEKLLEHDHYDLIITSDPGDYHQDHVNTFQIVNSACRGIADELWTMEIPPYSHRNTKFNPTVFVDITTTFHEKLQSLMCYKSYINEKTLRAITGLSMYRGQATKTDFAEAFKQIFKVIK